LIQVKQGDLERRHVWFKRDDRPTTAGACCPPAVEAVLLIANAMQSHYAGEPVSSAGGGREQPAGFGQKRPASGDHR